MHSTLPAGQLHLGMAGTKTGGKLIDEWTFESAFLRSERVKVEVYMRKGHAGFNRTGRVDFSAHCPALPDGIITSTDIEDLRVRVEAALRGQADLKSGVVWEPWLEVIVKGGSSTFTRPINNEQLVIEYRSLLRGRNPDSAGGDFTINSNQVAVAFPKPKKAGFKSDGVEFKVGDMKGMMSDGRDEDAEYSYIVDSPENRAALEGLIHSLRTLRARLAEFLGQDGIAGALVTLQAKSELLALQK